MNAKRFFVYGIFAVIIALGYSVDPVVNRFNDAVNPAPVFVAVPETEARANAPAPSVPSASVVQSNLVEGNFEYEVLDGGKVRITRFIWPHKNGVEVVIPAQIKGMPVTEIRWQAFRLEQGDSNKGVTKITFPASVTAIGHEAFMNNTLLASLDLPGVTIVDNLAFNKCTSLTAVNAPVLTTVVLSAFYECSKLTTVNAPMLTTIGPVAFADTALTRADFPRATAIGAGAFAGTQLTNVSFPLVTT
jgi:hypothetical protein